MESLSNRCCNRAFGVNLLALTVGAPANGTGINVSKSSRLPLEVPSWLSRVWRAPTNSIVLSANCQVTSPKTAVLLAVESYAISKSVNGLRSMG